jgi:hypothetical protein
MWPPAGWEENPPAASTRTRNSSGIERFKKRIPQFRRVCSQRPTNQEGSRITGNICELARLLHQVANNLQLPPDGDSCQRRLRRAHGTGDWRELIAREHREIGKQLFVYRGRPCGRCVKTRKANTTGKRTISENTICLLFALLLHCSSAFSTGARCALLRPMLSAVQSMLGSKGSSGRPVIACAACSACGNLRAPSNEPWRTKWP